MSCCDLPPVEANYTPKGSYSTFNDLKTYSIGSEDSKQVLLFVYDIFGFSPQILQGADLLASQGFKVVMPDFLVGEYATAEMFQPGNEDKRNEYFSRFPGAIASQSGPISKAISLLKSAADVKLGAIGACWGYKTVVTNQAAKELSAFAGLHPSFGAEDDAEKMTFPVAILSTAGEDTDLMDSWNKAVESKNPGKNVFKHYANMPHGFMGARADLSGGRPTEAYAEGYQIISKFFKEHL